VSDRVPLLPDDWPSLEPLIDRLLDAPSSERPALLAQLAGDNPARRAELERLMAECERDLLLLERPAAERFAQLREEEEPSLPEVLGGRYRIERELGRGGMARVYLAHDARHGRRVAVKVIRHEIASSLMRDRFLREIGIAARLRHPNIMPLYDSGDMDGLLYFVMPYEEGDSLRARLDTARGLRVAEGVSILRDVARALAYAHEQNVVHRDIKPDNVLLSGGAAVVTDFGIAKAVTVAATETGIGTATQTGTVIGTPVYMAPEQALGDATTDHRADIYAFGCLAYEVFAGVPPFTGTTTQVIAAKLSEQPKPLTDHRPDVPSAVVSLIERCLERNPDERPASASELLDVLGTSTATTEQEQANRPRSRWPAAAVVGLALIVLAGSYAALAIRGRPVPIALVTLQVTGDSAQALAAGFSDDLTTALVRKPWLKVMSRGGARNYLGRGEIDPRAAGDSLQVRYLLMASYHDAGGGIAVMMQLINCEDAAIVWAEKFSNPVHLEALRDDIADAVGDTLRRVAGRFSIAFTGRTRDAEPRPRSSNRDAYTLYLLGRKMIDQRPPNMRDNLSQFRQAIALDSNYAAAWAGLSLALALSAATHGVHVDSVGPEIEASAARAIQLDQSLHEAHVAMGVLDGLRWQWGQAEAEFRKALRVNPNIPAEARIQYARLLLLQNRQAEADEQIAAAREADPVNSTVLSFKGHSHLLRRQLDSALVWSDRAMQSNQSNTLARNFRAVLMVQLGKYDEARQLARSSSAHEPYSMFVLAATGDSATVRNRLDTLSKQNHAMLETARAYALLGFGDTTAALNALERATERREAWPTISYPALPVLDAVRDSPRFRALLRRVRLAA